MIFLFGEYPLARWGFFEHLDFLRRIWNLKDGRSPPAKGFYRGKLRIGCSIGARDQNGIDVRKDVSGPNFGEVRGHKPGKSRQRGGIMLLSTRSVTPCVIVEPK